MRTYPGKLLVVYEKPESFMKYVKNVSYELSSFSVFYVFE